MCVAARMLLVWLAVFLVKSSPVAAAPPLEARCSELGAVCLCSEPMNWLQDGGALYGGSHDPPDSEGPQAKECGGNGETVDWDPDAPIWNSVLVPNRPVHASADWQYVQRITHDGVNEYNWWYGVPASTANGTLCTRRYQSIGTLPWMNDPTQRIKVAQWTGNLQQTTQLEWRGVKPINRTASYGRRPRIASARPFRSMIAAGPGVGSSSASTTTA